MVKSGVLRVALVLALALSVASCAATHETATGAQAAEGSGVSGGKVQLVLRLRPGTSFRQRVTSEQNVVRTQQGQEIPMHQATAFTYRFDALPPEGPAELTRVKMTYEQITFHQQAGGTQIDYDSAHPPAQVSPVEATFAGLVGESLILSFNPDGEVEHIDGTGPIVDKILRLLAIPEGPNRENLRKGLERQLGEDALKANFKRMIFALPKTPVAVGDNWETMYTTAAGSPMCFDDQMTVKTMNKGKLTAQVNSKISPPPDAKPVVGGQMSILTTLSGAQTGSVVIDEATGWTESAELTQDLGGQIVMTSIAGDQTMTVPIKIKSTSKIELVQSPAKP